MWQTRDSVRQLDSRTPIQEKIIMIKWSRTMNRGWPSWIPIHQLFIFTKRTLLSFGGGEVEMGVGLHLILNGAKLYRLSLM
nr:hypothetical protein Iba_scaffold18189CG0010 [Ipomoea batatas]